MDEKRPPGQPSKICQKTREQIYSAIKKNLPYAMAAWYARITERTIYNWMAWGKEDAESEKDTEFRTFFHDIKQIEATKIIEHLDAVEEQTERWQARMTILARRWREVFGEDASQLAEIKELGEKFAEWQAKGAL